MIPKEKYPTKCPRCGSSNYAYEYNLEAEAVFGNGRCRDCGFDWVEHFYFDHWEEA